MKKVLIFFLLTTSFLSFSQESANKDDLIVVPSYFSKWRIIGVEYESFNKNFGISFGNGLEHYRLIHFEELDEKLLFDVKFLSNLDDNYSLKASFATHYWMPLSPIGITFEQRRLNEHTYFQRNVSVGGSFTFLDSNIPGSVIAKVGFQELNTRKNLGFSLGWETSIAFNRKRPNHAMGFGFIYENYIEYNNYKVYLNALLRSSKLSFRLSYERISNYNFLNFGLNLAIYKIKEYETYY